MKTKLQKLLIAIAGLLVSANAFAYDFKVDGICYNIISSEDRTVEVTYNDKYTFYHNYDTKYVGEISIPPKVIGNSITYSVTSIDDYAFASCSGMTSITLPNSITSVGLDAFEDCNNLTDVNISDLSAWCKINFYLTDSNPLYNGAVLKLNGTIVTDDLVIPNSVTRIGDYVFVGYDRLTSVTIPNSVTSVGSGAFYDCNNLTDVNISDLSAWCKINFYSDASNPLYNGAVLKLNGTIVTDDLVIPNSVTSIGDYVFAEYDRLTSLTIPNSVTSIGDHAFRECTGLTSVTIGNSVISIGWLAFYNCTGLTSVTIPNSVTSIGWSAFSGCDGLESVTIQNEFIEIGYHAFSCKGGIYCSPKTPPTKCHIGAFTDDALMYSTLYVPLGCKSAYESVDPWRNFWNIVEMDFSDIDEIAIVESADLSISVNGGEIVVNNADNCNVAIYSLAGQPVYSNNAYNNECIALSKGVYIVKAGGKTQKVII